MKRPAIGIVGGVGPAAGTDLCAKVFANTKALRDQDHIDLYLVSCPSLIPDRTGYLLEGGPNPKEGIFVCLKKLVAMGATALAVCCNTAHSKRIIGELNLASLGPDVRFVDLIDETCQALHARFPEGGRIGLLGTVGTLSSGVYDEKFERWPSLELVKCARPLWDRVNDAIYNKVYGIKANSRATEEAVGILLEAVSSLKDEGCKAVVLGCTELPLALSDANSPLPVVDPTEILARALIRATEPEKLKLA